MSFLQKSYEFNNIFINKTYIVIFVNNQFI